MAIAKLTELLRQLERNALVDNAHSHHDGALLHRFFTDGDQNAFAFLVRRYGAMVLGVCSRILHNTHDTEDAFQAVFLVLVRQGRSLVGRATIGNWLYGVAYHTALKARSASVLRRAKESQAAALRSQPVDANDAEQWRPLLDQEVNRLPAKYREAFILCDLLGNSRNAVATQLGIPEGTLSGRLTVARRQLAKRLSRLGVTLGSSGIIVGSYTNSGIAAVPSHLITRTVETACAVATAAGTLGTVASPSVAVLVEEVMKTTVVKYSKTLVACALSFGLLVLSVAGWAVANVRASGMALASNPSTDEHRDFCEGDNATSLSGSGAFVSFNEGTLTLKGKSGLVSYKQIDANYKTYEDNDRGIGAKEVNTVDALKKLAPGMMVQIDGERRVIRFGLDFRVVGLLDSYKDGKLTLLPPNPPKGLVNVPSEAVILTIPATTPTMESIAGGDFKLSGTADQVLKNAKQGTLITVRSEYDPDRIDVLQLGEPKRQMERYVGQSRGTVRGTFLSWKDGLLRLRGKGINPLASEEYERVVLTKIPADVPISESIDGAPYQPTTIEALKNLKEGTVLTIRRVEYFVLEVQIGVAKEK